MGGGREGAGLVIKTKVGVRFSVVLAALLSASALAAALPAPIDDGLTWLEADQNADGSWGSSLQMIVTPTVLETLAAIDPCRPSASDGAAWLASQSAANHEFLARQVVGLSGVTGYDGEAAELADELLALRNPVENDSMLPNWPEGGWGLAPGFETDSLTTALAMLALGRTGFNGGFAVTDVSVAPAATDVQVWEIAADAVRVRLLITVTGDTVHLRMTEGAPPTPFDPWFILPPGGPYEILYPDFGVPFTAGTNYISLENVGAVTATYSMTASYETPGFDTRTLAEPLEYLRQAQNADGGWGAQRGQPTELYTTAHVLLALVGYAQYDLDGAIADGIVFVKGQQLGDGSFGFGGTPVPYMTALGLLDLVRSETAPFSTETQGAAVALQGQQATDGSWSQHPYDTALAMLALWEYDEPPTADAGTDQTVNDLDGNCLETVTLSGSGLAVGGAIDGYAWTEGCVEIATGASATVTLSIGSHEISLTVTDSGGLTATDTVTVVVEGNDTCLADADGDGVLDDGDFSGTNGDNPCPHQITQGCDDNCPALANPGQDNIDSDRLGDLCDCDAANGNVWAQPGQVGLTLSHDGTIGETEITWAAADPGGAIAPIYDTLRSDDASDFVTAAVCVESDDGDTMTIDTNAPAPGGVFNYLVRAENDCPGAGSLGRDSDGAERPGAACP